MNASSTDLQKKAAIDNTAQATPLFSPLYQQIKELLLQRLQTGQWVPGQVIPSEIELAQQLGVSQGTVRKAVDELAADRLLVRKQGKGTFVTTHTEQYVQYRFLRLRPDNLSQEQEGPAKRRIMHCRKSRSTARIAKQLGLINGDASINIRRLLYLQETPAVLEDIWLPAQSFVGLTAKQIDNFQGPMYALLEKEYGVHMICAEERLKATLCPDQDSAELLKISLQTPLLHIERVSYTYNNKAMEVRRGYYLTDHHHYHNVIN